MWEKFTRTPRGRMSTRKFVMMIATFLVTVFGYSFVASTPVFAIEATWKDEKTIVYDGKEYIGPLSYDSSSSTNFDPIPLDSVLFLNKQANASSGASSIIYFEPSKKDSYPSESEASIVSFDYKTTNGNLELSNPKGQATISITPRAPPASSSSSSSGGCNVDGGLGWVVCPVTNTLAAAMDSTYSLISKFLRVQPLLTTTDNPLYRAWDVFKNLANIAFIISFLVIIYSQLSGAAMSNYTLKKLLPRVIVAAILVNVSYWICAAAVDLSNILGYAVQDLFMSLRTTVGIEADVDVTDTINASAIAALILGGGTATIIGVAVVATAGIGFIWIFLAMLVPLAFVVLVAFLILAARQAIITILIVLAPLAFVAYLLPNTEKWFEKWRSTLFTLLIMFPAFSVVFGGAQLASGLIISGNARGNDTSGDFLMVLLAWGVQVAPLAITPLLLKLGGGVLNRFAGIVNNPSKGVFDRLKNSAKERGDLATARGRANNAMMANQNRLRGLKRVDNWRTRGKLAREGEKASQDALLKGYFTQTAQGARVHRLNERAKMEQGLGDHQNQASWENEVRTNPYLRNRAIQSHDYHARAELYKADVDGEGEEHWQHALQHDAQLRAIKTDTHLAKGRAKVIEEALTSADEYTLQQQISVTPNLRGLQIQGSVNTKAGDLLKKEVESEAALQYQNIVETSYLRTVKRDAHLAEGEAKIIEEQLTAADESFFQRQVNSDVNRMRQRKIDTTVSTERANLYKGAVEAEGQMVYSDILRNSSGLQGILDQTVEFQKRGESAKAIAQKTAEARFDQRSHTQQDLIQLRAEQEEAERLASEQENLVKEMLVDMAQDGSAPAGANTATEAAARNILAARQRQNMVKNRTDTKEDVIAKQDKAAWENALKTDQDIRRLRLQQTEAEALAKTAEDKSKEFMTEVRVAGRNALDGSDPKAFGDMAKNIKKAAMDQKVISDSIANTEIEEKDSQTELIRENENLRLRAAGMNTEGAVSKLGAARVLGRTRAERSKRLGENVETMRAIYSESTLNELRAIQNAAPGETVDMPDGTHREPTYEERFAAQYEIVMKKGNHEAVLEAWEENNKNYGMAYDEDTNQHYIPARDEKGQVITDRDTGKPKRDGNQPNGGWLTADEAESRSDAQQIFLDAYQKGSRKIKMFSGTEQGLMAAGLSIYGMRDSMISEINNGKVEASDLSSANIDEYDDWIRCLRDPEFRKQLSSEGKASVLERIDEAQRAGGLEPRIFNAMSMVANYLEVDDSIDATVPESDGSTAQEQARQEAEARRDEIEKDIRYIERKDKISGRKIRVRVSQTEGVGEQYLDDDQPLEVQKVVNETTGDKNASKIRTVKTKRAFGSKKGPVQSEP